MTGFLEGKQIELVSINTDHVEIHLEWLNDARVRAHYRRMYPTRIDLFKKEIEKVEESQRRVQFELVEKSTQTPIGLIGFDALNWPNRFGEISMMIGDPTMWNRGYGTDAVQLLLKYGFDELNLHKILTMILAPNRAALRVAEKCGMRLEGTFKADYFLQGTYVDDLVYSILETEWKKARTINAQ